MCLVNRGWYLWVSRSGALKKKHSDLNVSFRWFCELSVEGTDMKGGHGMRWGVLQVPGHRVFLMLLHVCPTFRKDGSSFKPSLSYCTQKQKGLITFEDINMWNTEETGFIITVYKYLDHSNFSFFFRLILVLKAFLLNPHWFLNK